MGRKRVFFVRKIRYGIIVEDLFYLKFRGGKITDGKAEIGISVTFVYDEISDLFCGELYLVPHVIALENMHFIAI